MSGSTPVRGHAVKLTAEVKHGRATLYTLQCVCGWDAPLCSDWSRVRELYREHCRTAPEYAAA